MNGKTVVLLSKFPPVCGQVSTLNFWLARGLAARGVKVLVCSDSHFQAKRAVCFADSKLSSEANNLFEGIHVTNAAALSGQTFLPFSDLSFVSYLAAANEVVERHSPDLIFSHYLEPYAIAGHFLAEKHGIPHIVTHAASDLNRLCSFPEVKTLMTYILQQATVFIPKSRFAADFFGIESEVRLAPYFPDLSVFRSRRGDRLARRAFLNNHGLDDHGEPLIGFYGKFVAGKKLDVALDALVLFRQKHQTGRMIFAGGDIGGSFSLSSLIAERGLQDFVDIVGFIPNWQIPDLINSCDLMLYLKSGYLTQTHNSLVVRELVACNATAIVTREALKGLTREMYVGESIYVVEDAISADGLKDAMEIALKSDTAPLCARGGMYKQAHSAFIASWCDLIDRSLRG